MQLPISFDALILQATQSDLYTKLIVQLNKDLALANVDLDFDEEVLPTSLKLILQDSVFKLIQEKFTEYLNLLYLIDVSEEKVRTINESDAFELSEQVTFLILQREWQKVWYRNMF